ncbi:hypothetical protein Hte_004974 [Hypoxylon texense]
MDMLPPLPFHACSSPICSSISQEPIRPCDRCQKVAYCSRKCEIVSWALHKPVCHLRNYIVKFQAAPDVVDNPPVVRILSCPALATLSELHEAVKIAFGWTSPGAFYFAILDDLNPDYVKVTQEESQDLVQHILALSVGSLNLDPNYDFPSPGEVWQPGIPTLQKAADALIQLPVQDQSEEFLARMPKVPSPSDRYAKQPLKIQSLIKPDECKLYQLFDNPRCQRLGMAYIHDKGGRDWWEHSMTVTGLADFTDCTDEFECVGGSGHPMSEGKGGPRCWELLKSIYKNPRPNQLRDRIRRWYEASSNGDPRGLEGHMIHEWDRDRINRDLRSMADRGRGAARALPPNN